MSELYVIFKNTKVYSRHNQFRITVPKTMVVQMERGLFYHKVVLPLEPLKSLMNGETSITPKDEWTVSRYYIHDFNEYMNSSKLKRCLMRIKAWYNRIVYLP